MLSMASFTSYSSSMAPKLWVVVSCMPQASVEARTREGYQWKEGDGKIPITATLVSQLIFDGIQLRFCEGGETTITPNHKQCGNWIDLPIHVNSGIAMHHHIEVLSRDCRHLEWILHIRIIERVLNVRVGRARQHHGVAAQLGGIVGSATLDHELGVVSA